MSLQDKMKCPLCAYSFSEEGIAKCDFCQEKGKCNLVCCPNCGYSFPNQISANSKGRSFLSLFRRSK